VLVDEPVALFAGTKNRDFITKIALKDYEGRVFLRNFNKWRGMGDKW
jgi:hypothetical protein